MNPKCPFNPSHTLKLETLNIWEVPPMGKRSSLGRGAFYVCHRCGKHWPRSAALVKATARDGVKAEYGVRA